MKSLSLTNELSFAETIGSFTGQLILAEFHFIPESNPDEYDSEDR